MNYGYKIINTDPTLAFVKRVLLYLAILTITVSLALIVLFILFERYLSLIAPVVLILASIVTMILVGGRGSVCEYTLSDNALKVVVDGKEFVFELSKMSISKNAENSDFIDKNILKLSFIKNRIVLKNVVNNNTLSVKNYVFTYENKQYIAAFDDYTIALIKGAKDEL